MADQTNDTQSKIDEEDKDLQQRQHSTTGQNRDDFNQGSSSMPGGGGEAEGQFAQQGEAAMGGALGGGPDGTGNTGAGTYAGGLTTIRSRTTGGGATTDSRTT